MNECCQNKANRVAIEKRTMDAGKNPNDLTVEQCKVCGRKHYELSVDPIELGLVGLSL